MSNTELLKRLRWATIHLRAAITELRALARAEQRKEEKQVLKFVKWDFKYKGTE